MTEKFVTISYKDNPITNLCKSCGTIVHYRAGIVISSQMVNLPEVILQKVILHAFQDVVPVDGDVAVPVRPALLMPEAAGMHQLMHNNT